MKYQEIEGNLVELALNGQFNIIAHGCNCFCRMKRGIAPQIAKEFDSAEVADNQTETGDFNKLGNYSYSYQKGIYIINCYSQFRWDSTTRPLDYEALTLCLRKINMQFPGKHIGLPKIGCGLAGGNWDVVKKIIQQELKNMNITIVIYKNNKK